MAPSASSARTAAPPWVRRLDVTIRHGGRVDDLAYRCGSRESHQTTAGDPAVSSTTLRFSPDASILTVTEVSPAIFRSYLRRLSYLHRGVRFSFAHGDESHEFHAERGLLDLFAAISAPYQLLHEPIHMEFEHGTLHLEAVLAYHGWKEDGLWCFINNGRAVEGGTHEMGLRDALKRLDHILKRPEKPKANRNGVVGILSIHYPDAVWEGCVKTRVGNPELRGMVRELIVRGVTEWSQRHPEMVEQLRTIEPFQFPDAWHF